MALGEKDFIGYQLFVRNFFNNYNNELQSGLKKQGYISRCEQGFVYLIGKKDKKIISLSDRCKKISYGNVMDFYELFPYEIEKRNIELSTSKLEIILEKICKQEFISLAFDKGLSLNICGQKKFVRPGTDSVFIPMRAIIDYNTNEIIQRISKIIEPEKNISDRINNFLRKTANTVEYYFHPG